MGNRPRFRFSRRKGADRLGTPVGVPAWERHPPSEEDSLLAPAPPKRRRFRAPLRPGIAAFLCGAVFVASAAVLAPMKGSRVGDAFRAVFPVPERELVPTFNRVWYLDVTADGLPVVYEDKAVRRVLDGDPSMRVVTAWGEGAAHGVWAPRREVREVSVRAENPLVRVVGPEEARALVDWGADALSVIDELERYATEDLKTTPPDETGTVTVRFERARVSGMIHDAVSVLSAIAAAVFTVMWMRGVR